MFGGVVGLIISNVSHTLSSLRRCGSMQFVIPNMTIPVERGIIFPPSYNPVDGLKVPQRRQLHRTILGRGLALLSSSKGTLKLNIK